MAAASTGAATPKWVIDLHGMRDALTSTSNSSKKAVIDAIRRGEMLIMKSVSAELKDLYPHLWPLLKAITPKTYIKTMVANYASATALQELHGSGVLGGLPMFARFEAVAVARSKGCKLVSADKALKDCKEIAKGCGIPKSDVIGISDL